MPIDLARLELAAGIIDDAVRDGYYPTAVDAVADAHEILWFHAASGEDNIAFDSIFTVASITKPVTATAIFQLVEQGKLILNVPIAQYFPEFGANGKERITAWHILTHSSGLSEDEIYAQLQAMRGLPPDGWLFEQICRSRPTFEPGSAHRYVTLSFRVLAELIKLLTGLPHPEYMRRNIFEPLGMKDTSFAPVDPERVAPVHNFGPPEEAAAWIALADPGGGLWSTATDLVRFGQAYLRGGEFDGYRLISPASIALMTRHYSPGEYGFGTNERFNYGAGWAKPSMPPNGDLLASPRAFGHGGASGSQLWIDPDYGFVHVYLSNGWNIPDANDARARVLNVIYGASDPGR